MKYLILISLILFIVVYYKILKIIGHENFESKKAPVTINDSNTEIFLINLAKNKDRFLSFSKQFNNSDMKNMKFTHINAVLGTSIVDTDLRDILSEEGYSDLILSEKRGYRIKHHQMTRGSIGCYLSHMKTYKAFLEGDKDYAIIFEDDVNIKNKNFISSINNIIPTLPNDWDIVLCGCVCYVCHKYKSYYDTKKFILLHSYIINKEGAKKIYNHLDSIKINKQIDSELSDMLQDNKLKIYCLTNQLSIQNNQDFTTTIQMPIKYIEGVNPFI